MIADVGRTVCNLMAPNGEIYAFFNSVIETKSNAEFYGAYEAASKYKIVFSETEKKRKYRALHYARYLANGILESNLRIVPYVENENIAYDASAVITPLYEAITPTIGQMPGLPGFNLMFWSNLSEKKNTLEKDAVGSFIYDSKKILRFENDKLEEVDLDNYSVKILCSAVITWERLRTSWGGVQDEKAYQVPVIKKVYVLSVQEGNIAIDFSGGGSGGGIGRHNHSDNSNGGFAYAVFAPGTSLQPINWK